MAIDYNKASQTYDSTRHSDERILKRWQDHIPFTQTTRVLDFGCGTGNYLQQLHDRFGVRCFGVEPSAGMRQQAIAKNPEATICDGDHRHIPFPDNTFDFIYMTDVVHHVPDLVQMFTELHRVLRPARPEQSKKAGSLCIITESHSQVQARFYNRYFPSLAENECRRYPSLATLTEAARPHFAVRTIETIAHPERQIDDTFIRNVAAKNYSMFRLLTDVEFAAGLKALRQDKDRRFPANGAGYSLVWFDITRC